VTIYSDVCCTINSAVTPLASPKLRALLDIKFFSLSSLFFF
jgi:hypothetical protein